MLVVTTAVSRAQNSLYPLGKIEFIVLLSFFFTECKANVCELEAKVSEMEGDYSSK